MGGRKGAPDPLKEAFLATARGIAERTSRVRVDSLGRAAGMAMLRSSLLARLAELGVVEAGPVGTRLEQARNLGCPLMDPALDASGVDPGEALAAATVPRPATDPGEMYQRIQEYSLSRVGKKKALSATALRTDRRRSGAFFTPAWMAERLANMALGSLAVGPRSDPGRGLRLLDPACGDGRLLVACLRRLLETAQVAKEAEPEAIRQLVMTNLRGIDLDPVSVALARTSLWLLCDPTRGPVPDLSEAICNGDAIAGPVQGGRRSKLSIRWDKAYPTCCGPQGRGFDVVVANPPFEVLSGFQRRGGLKAYVEKIRKSGYDLALSGSLNTARLFLERGLQVLGEGGRLAFVLPFGFLMDRTAGPLRSHMLRSGWVEQVDVFPESSQAFDGVGQSVVLLGAAKSDGARRFVTVTDGPGRTEPHRVGLDQIERLDQEGMVLPICPGEAIGLAARMRAVNDSCVGDLADGRVGELDQTQYREFIRSKKTRTLLVRGSHLSAYRVDLGASDPHERWVEGSGFEKARGGGRWREDWQSARVVQTGIVNIEAGRRLVAAEVPAGVVLGNSVNYWVPLAREGWQASDLRTYLLALLNSAPLEWRFRLTSSNNNVNLYEIRALPLPRLIDLYPAERIHAFVERSSAQIRESRVSPLGLVRQITAGWGAPGRNDRAVAFLLGRVARMRADEKDQDRVGWFDHVLDHLVNWHLGLDEPDLERMLEDVPARAWKETE